MIQQSDPSFWQFVQSVDEEILLSVGFFVFVVVLVVVVASAITVNAIAKRRIDSALKRDMLDRGMTAEDIATVIEADVGAGRRAHRHMRRGPHDDLA